MGDKPTKVEGEQFGIRVGYGYTFGNEKPGFIKCEPDHANVFSLDKFYYAPHSICPPLPQWLQIYPCLPCSPWILPTWNEPIIDLKHPVNENEKIVTFINDRAGKEVLSLSNVDSIEVSRGKANDGEMKIRIVTGSNFFGAPKVRLIIVRADGAIYEENLEEKRVKVGNISREDASALIASRYGKKELGQNAAPSDKHIESVTKAVKGEVEFDIDIFGGLTDLPFNVPYLPNYPWHKSEDSSDFFFYNSLSGIRMYYTE